MYFWNIYGIYVLCTWKFFSFDIINIFLGFLGIIIMDVFQTVEKKTKKHFVDLIPFAGLKQFSNLITHGRINLDNQSI